MDADDLDGDLFRICDGDCDDDLASVYDGAIELCDELDNDCDGETDEDFVDSNSNGRLDCLEEDLDEDRLTPAEGDCDDSNTDIYDGAPELCDGVDTDCNGELGPDEDSDGILACEDGCDTDPDITDGACADLLLDADGDYTAGGCGCSTSPGVPVLPWLSLIAGIAFLGRRRRS